MYDSLKTGQQAGELCVPILRLSLLQLEAAFQTVQDKQLVLTTNAAPSDRYQDKPESVDHGVCGSNNFMNTFTLIIISDLGSCVLQGDCNLHVQSYLTQEERIAMMTILLAQVKEGRRLLSEVGCIIKKESNRCPVHTPAVGVMCECHS